MLCSNCGNEIDNTSVFCSNCGQERQVETFIYQPAAIETPGPYAFPTSPWQHVPGRNYLMAAGILLIVFGVVGVLISLVGISFALYLDRSMPVRGISWSVYYTVTLISGVLGIFIGIIGVVNRARPGRAGLCMILAVVYIAVSVIVAIIASVIFFAGSFAGIIIIFLAFDIVLPIVYFIGGMKNSAVTGSLQ